MKDLKKFVKSFEKYGKREKKQNISNKNYLKELVIKEKEKGSQIEPYELSIKFGTTKKEIEELIEEINEENKLKDIPKSKKESKIKNYFKKSKEKTKKVIDDADKITLKDIFLKIIVFGIPINFSLWCFTFHPFSWYSWFAYGYTLWLIKKELVNIVRSLWIR